MVTWVISMVSECLIYDATGKLDADGGVCVREDENDSEGENIFDL